METICFIVQAHRTRLSRYFPYVQMVLSSSLSPLSLTSILSSCTDITVSPFYRRRNQGKKRLVKQHQEGRVMEIWVLAVKVIQGKIAVSQNLNFLIINKKERINTMQIYYEDSVRQHSSKHLAQS